MNDDINKTRFWARVTKSQTCWIWNGGSSSGYGAMSYRGTLVKAHRLAAFWAGLIDSPIGGSRKYNLIRHTCDNSKCVNPSHLLKGTAQDNVNDAINRGRRALGDKHGKAVLSNTQVLEIKSRIAANNETYRQIAKDYSVSMSTISAIKSGRRQCDNSSRS